MNITITGKPCSGKGTVSKLFCEKYNFDYVCTGDMQRELAKQYGFTDFLEYLKSDVVKKSDFIIDNNIKEIGTKRINDDIVFDSRLAWHFVPKSFKVFIDVDIDEAGRRLMQTDRHGERPKHHDHAKELLTKRWDTENERYLETYGINNLNNKNYDLIISSSNKTPEELCDEIFKEYQKFLKKNK